MGLSSSSSKTNTTQNQNTNQTETGATTPITPDWLQQAAQGYVGRIGAFGNMDPNSFVAPGSPLQNMAWNNASSLGDWRQQTATASQMAQQAGQGGANYAGNGGAMGRWAGMAGLTPNVQMSGGGGTQMPSFGGSAQTAADALGSDKMMQHTGNMPLPVGQQPQMPQSNAFSGASSMLPGGYNMGGPAYQAHPSSYTPPQLNAPGLVSGQGYAPPSLGQAGGYAAARTGQPIGAAAQGYGPSTMQAANIAQTPGATASNAGSASVLDNLGAYQNPYDTQVRQTALSDFDNNAAQQRAALEARGAAAGAFGGSRFGIAQGQLAGDQTRGRATLDAGLLDQGFNTAAGLSQYDASNRQQSDLFNAQNQTGISQFNAGQDASRAMAQAGFGQQAGLANQSAMDTASQFGAGAQNASQMQYADAANRAALDYSGRSDTASQFGLGQQQQRDLSQAGFADTAARYGADSGMQAALANQNMAGQYGLAQGNLNQAAGQFNAGAQNQASQYNAGANNQMSQFNAQQGDVALQRQLAAAGMLGGLANDYGAGTRADLGTMSGLGDQQRAIEQAYAMAGPAQLQLMGQLSGMTPYDILVGRQVNGNTQGTMTGTGTSNTTQSPSLFSNMMQMAQAAAAFAPSDRRLKRRVSKIGELANGLGLYLYRYLWDDRQRVGVMADEVARISPEALGPTLFGFATVDYARLGLAHLVEA